MNSLQFFFSPFEQLVVTSSILADLFILGQQLNIMSLPVIDFTISNVTINFFFFFSTAAFIIKLVKSPFNETFYVMPTSLEGHFHLGYLVIQATLQKYAHVKYYQQVVFTITFVLAILLLLLNLTNNFPIFMSLTSHFVIISFVSLPSIFGCFITISHSLRFFSLLSHLIIFALGLIC